MNLEVFRRPDSLLYRDNCRALQAAAARGEARLVAWTRGAYPGVPLGAALPGVRTVGYWDARVPQSWGLARHCNEGIKVALVSRGNLVFDVDGETHALARGSLIVTRPWQLHSLGAPHVGASRLIWVMLDLGLHRPNGQWHWPDWFLWSAPDARRLMELLARDDRSVWSASASVIREFETITSILDSGDAAGSETRLKLVINALFISLLERLSADQLGSADHRTSSHHTVEVFLRRLSLALDRDWTLDAMASECGLSRTRFGDLCKTITNMTPMHYLNEMRLNRATELLQDVSAATITDVALRCGFGSSQYFATCYRRRFGYAPRERVLRTDNGRGKVRA
jgi:AraC-like DNA-binding protein